jgi:rhodanese-related sulfurtransferase
MLAFLRRLFNGGPAVNVAEWIANGAAIVDVCSREEYRAGHLKNSMNYQTTYQK